MKYLLAFSSTVLCLVIVLSLIPVNGEEKIYDNMIRLHVVANSDSEEDQRIKLSVRDAILGEFSDELSEAECFDAAYEKVYELEKDIALLAESTLKAEGKSYSVRTELGSEAYPTRTYDKYTLPAGDYASLQVVIGEGKGKNWWCVLFPPLCTDVSSKKDDGEYFIQAGISTEGYKLIKKEKETKYKIRFRILEIFSGILGYEY